MKPDKKMKLTEIVAHELAEAKKGQRLVNSNKVREFLQGEKDDSSPCEEKK